MGQGAHGGTDLVQPDFETVEVVLPWEANLGQEPLVRCPQEGAPAPLREAEANLRDAARQFCEAGLGRHTQFYVDARFRGSFDRLKGEDGWIDRAVLTYMGLAGPQDQVGGEEDLLLQSLHHFGRMPVVVANFGRRIPRSWTPERFPNLVLMHAPSTSELRRSFNFNKHTAMLFTKIKAGLVLDADQFAHRGLDYLLQRAGEETTREYPFPIMPVHWMSCDPEADDMKKYDASWTFQWSSPKGGPNRTMRWGHAHPTWSHHALPWLAKWTKYALAPQRFQREMPEWLSVQIQAHFFEDEDLMNVALWASNATKQWCKYDIPQPSDFGSYLLQKAPLETLADSKYYPRGIPLLFFTAHGAKHPNETHRYLRRLWDQGEDGRRAILYDRRWFESVEALRAYDPSLRCMV